MGKANDETTVRLGYRFASIDLNARPSVDSSDIQDGVVIDLDAESQIADIDIQQAYEILDLATLEN